MSKGEGIVPIPGTKRRERREENAAAAEITLSTLDEAVCADAVIGGRYAERDMALLNH